MGISQLLVCALLAVSPALAHPHGMEPEETYQHAALPLHRRSLSHCKAVFEEPAFAKRTIERRHAEVQRLKKERGLEHHPILGRRQLSKFLAMDHQVEKDFTAETKPEELFADDGDCMMSPLVSEGPLYVSGEQVRRNLTESERGIPLTLDFQVVNSKTCEPLKNAAVDIWSCNTTGIYSGVWTYYKLANKDEGYDRGVINSTALRGIQFTNEDGVATFDTLFPGHYDGRAVHIHAMVHTDPKREENGTITGGSIPHISQVYFDQSLITAVEKIEPYTLNRQTLTVNANDGLLRMTTTAQSDDPFMRYVMLGDKLEDGLFAYMRFGVDVDSDWSVNPAAIRDASGGHQNPDGPMGDGSQRPNIPPNPGQESLFPAPPAQRPGMPGMPRMPGR